MDVSGVQAQSYHLSRPEGGFQNLHRRCRWHCLKSPLQPQDLETQDKSHNVLMVSMCISSPAEHEHHHPPRARGPRAPDSSSSPLEINTPPCVGPMPATWRGAKGLPLPPPCALHPPPPLAFPSFDFRGGLNSKLWWQLRVVLPYAPRCACPQ